MPQLWIIFLLISNSLIVSYSKNFCQKDISEEMFKAELVVLAKVKNVSSDAEILIRISKVIKDTEGSQIMKPKKKITVRPGEGSCTADNLKQGRKYIFALSVTPSGWQLRVRPLRSSRRVKRISQNLFCERCGAGPVIKQVSGDRGVKMFRWRSLPCRLSSGKEPTVSFSWYFNGRLVTDSDNYKIRSRRSGSVLNIRGLPSTAGLYKCQAVSLAGSASLQVNLYVHGTVSSVCQAGYCLNGATCSVVTLAPGELQPVCNCSQGYAGLRCQLKHVTTNLTLTALVITVASVTLITATILIIYFYKRLRKIEKILRQQDTTQKLLLQKVAAKTDTSARAVVPLHNYHHCGHVRMATSNGPVKLQVTKSASSPGMSGLASSSESVKQRRPGAPDSLTLELCEESARVSPLYVEPWDGLAELCVHGKVSECEVCVREADTILSQCHTYTGNTTGPSGVFS